MDTMLRNAVATDSGMLALWNPEGFPDVHDYATWEPELLEDTDIQRHITAGMFVPINIGADGAFECEARVGEVGSPTLELTERERQYAVVSSKPYLFRSSRLCISGIEAIEATPAASIVQMPLPADTYSVIVHMIDWKREPGALDETGKPVQNALPDFVILLSPIPSDNISSSTFRQNVETFDL